MLAAEFLMPRCEFEARLPPTVSLVEIRRLAGTFDTSITATAIRCARFRAMCIFGVTGNRVTWGYGGVRPGAVALDPDRRPAHGATHGDRRRADAEIAEVRTEIASLETRLVRWMVGTVFATAALTVGILRLFG